MNRYRKRFQSGVCFRCQKPLPDDSPYVTCKPCRIGQRKKYHKIKATGRCVCGAERTEERTKLLCTKCYTKKAEYRLEYREEFRAVEKANRDAKREKGLCSCGHERENKQFTTCAKCRAYHQAYQKQRRAHSQSEGAK